MFWAKKNIVICFILKLSVICFVSLTVLHAEGIYLKDGRVMYGRIAFQDDYKIVVVTKYGKQTLKKANVKKISYDEGLGTITVVMNDKRTIKGILISINNKKVVIKEEKNKLQHTLARKDIESLFLKKFQGRRFNEIALYGGAIYPLGDLGKTTPISFLDFSFNYTRGLDFSESIYWGIDFSYIKLVPDAKKSPLENPSMIINPFLFFVEYRIPLFSDKLFFSLQAGFGASLVTLSETGESNTSTYATGQPALRLQYNVTDRVFMAFRSAFLYIYQKDLSLSSLRNNIALGINF